jgi:hypothetical protein
MNALIRAQTKAPLHPGMKKCSKKALKKDIQLIFLSKLYIISKMSSVNSTWIPYNLLPDLVATKALKNEG